MSVANAQKLMQRLSEDTELRNKIIAAKTPDEKRKIIEGAGYSGFDEKDVQAAAPSFSGELSDAELEAVAGGRVVEWVGATAAVVGAGAAAGAC
jgi:predicted ribosomally synthesized peptide with nif11-like leader